jgi:putative transposase
MVPSANIIDSQSVKTPESGGPRSFNLPKCVKGRKRHIVTDTTGLLLRVLVHTANVQDDHGAVALLRPVGRSFPKLQHVFADRVYRGDKLLNALADLSSWTIRDRHSLPQHRHFQGRTAPMCGRAHFRLVYTQPRLAKDFEASLASAET